MPRRPWVPTSPSATVRTLGLAVLCLSALGATGAVAKAGDAPEPLGPGERVNPISGVTLYVDPASRARRQADAWARERPADAALLDRIARQPQADWFGDWNGDVRAAVAGRTGTIRAAGATPVYVIYDVPFRDCGSHSAGGEASAEGYRRWVSEFTAGLGSGPAIVIVEPDAVAAADCLSEEGRAERFAMLAGAVRTLKARPGTTVYLDAGHPDWHAPAETAARLRRAGVEAGDGFALNISNTVETSRNVRYGEEVSRLLGGTHFVIDTSRNGAGAHPAGEWCNPSGRALGPAPTTRTGHPLVDAYLWIKRPGESDGVCNGGPRAGEWWPEYALALVQGSALAN